MTHEQVARTLDVPLGTAKTRIRSGLQMMRASLAPLAATLMALLLAVVGYAVYRSQSQLELERSAVILITTSDLVPLRLTPASPAVPANAHAKFFGKPDNDVAVLSTELLPPAPSGMTYQAWVRHGPTWTSLGTVDPTSQLIVRDPALKTPPESIEVTLEPAGSSSTTPTGTVVLSWPNGY